MSEQQTEAPAEATALVAIDSIKSALTEFDKIQAGLADLSGKFKGVVFDVKTGAGMKEASAARAEIREPRYSVEKLRKAAKAPVLELGRNIDQRAAWITGELMLLEGPIDAQIKAEEERREREREARVQAEQNRIRAIQAHIDEIKAFAIDVIGKPAAAIAEAMDQLEHYEIGDWAAEFKDVAEQSKVATMNRLNSMHAAAVDAEADAKRIADEQARIKAEREDLERRQAEQAARERDEAAKREAEERASRERIEAQERAARQEREEADRQAKLARDAEEARLRAIREEEEKRLRAERERLEKERLAKEQREREAREKAEAKAKAKRDKEEAAERERQRKETELMDARQMLEVFVTRFGHIKEFASVVKAIEACLVKERKAA